MVPKAWSHLDGGDTINVGAKTNITWNKKDHFMVQSIITVPRDNVF